MKKGQKLPTTTTVEDVFEASIGDKYFGTVVLYHVCIEDIHTMYVVEYDSLMRTGGGIEYKHFGRYENDAKAFFDSEVAEIKKDIVKALSKEIA